MADLLLTDSDLDLTDGDLSWVIGLDAVIQDCTMTLRTWLEETPYDLGAGVPYLQVIFQRGVSLFAVRFIVEQILLARDGVEGRGEQHALGIDERVVEIEDRERV